MATWVTHLMIADEVTKSLPFIKKHKFFVGNIAPNYIDNLPKGAIVCKVKVMGYIPEKEISQYPYIGMTKEEYGYFVKRATQMVVEAIERYREKHCNGCNGSSCIV